VLDEAATRNVHSFGAKMEGANAVCVQQFNIGLLRPALQSPGPRWSTTLPCLGMFVHAETL
jgi:hypothetical protein